MHSRSDDRAMYGPLGSLPGVPSSDGMTTVNPASTTSLANFVTSGVIPGISCTTTTPGPLALAVRRVGHPGGGERSRFPAGQHVDGVAHASLRIASRADSASTSVPDLEPVERLVVDRLIAHRAVQVAGVDALGDHRQPPRRERDVVVDAPTDHAPCAGRSARAVRRRWGIPRARSGRWPGCSVGPGRTSTRRGSRRRRADRRACTAPSRAPPRCGRPTVSVRQFPNR